MNDRDKVLQWLRVASLLTAATMGVLVLARFAAPEMGGEWAVALGMLVVFAAMSAGSD